MTDYRQKLGRFGERIAATHLEANGYHIVTRNWRCREGEVDIVAQLGEMLVLVEVRTRRGSQGVSPEASITPTKAQQMMRVAEAYLYENELEEVDMRIDMIAVVLDAAGKLVRLTHYDDAIGESW